MLNMFKALDSMLTIMKTKIKQRIYYPFADLWKEKGGEVERD